MKKSGLILMSVFAVLLMGCAEHELCERDRSMSARAAMSLEKILKPGATPSDYAESARLFKESAALGEEIEFRKISCKK